MSLCICLLINVDHRRCQTVDQSLLLTHHPGPDSINIPARNFEIPLPGEKKNGQNLISRLRTRNLFHSGTH